MGPGTPFAISPLVPLTPQAGQAGPHGAFHPGEAAMTTPLPIEVRFSRTLRWTAVPARRKRRPRRRVGVNGAPALPGYTILGVLGRGGMAIVYKARQLRPKRLVALKVIDGSLSGEGQIIARFRHEQALSVRL